MKSAIAILFAGLTGSAFVQPLMAAERAASKATIVYSFCSRLKDTTCRDGDAPDSGLIALNGLLYGTTTAGGAHGSGTIFELDPATGAERILHAFCNKPDCADGAIPSASLIDVAGTFFGTTFGGGAHGGGTVFSLNPATRKETVLYSFCGKTHCTDGMDPAAPLIMIKGKLYGTTETGGSANKGAVFSVNPATGVEKILYSFCSSENCTDGERPTAGLLNVKSTLYGTTYFGGANDFGTVFALDLRSGSETVVYSFCRQKNCKDGEYPAAGLIDVSGTLYGTTYSGGIYGDFGTVFSIDPDSGTEAVIHAFGSSDTDGRWPTAGLTAIQGVLYGTTQAGGANGNGTMFALDTDGNSEAVLYSFCSEEGCPDGNAPNGLIHIKGTLYGTAGKGGANCVNEGGCGTVFSLKR